jgi:hypothetical protein
VCVRVGVGWCGVVTGWCGVAWLVAWLVACWGAVGLAVLGCSGLLWWLLGGLLPLCCCPGGYCWGCLGVGYGGLLLEGGMGVLLAGPIWVFSRERCCRPWGIACGVSWFRVGGRCGVNV